jgi:hypothetical protein
VADGPQALVSAAAAWLPEPEPTSRLGIDETRFRSVRWILDGITWKRSDPWLTSFVDCSRDGPGSLLGLAPGRTGACVREWLGEQSAAFRRRIEIVVIDPSAPYASGIRAALPNAKIAVGIWHLVALANQMVAEVRQRATREQLGRRGTSRDPIWVNRRLLLTGVEHLSRKQAVRLWRSFDICDPTKEIQAAWAVKERLRLLLKQRERGDLVVGNSDRPHPRRQQRTHRRLQSSDQTNQTRWLRVQITTQLPAPYPQPHRGHSTAEIGSMNGTTPLKFEEPRIGTPGPSSHIRISRIIGTSRLSDQQRHAGLQPQSQSVFTRDCLRQPRTPLSHRQSIFNHS